ncbi:MAG: 30S ribosomal protein S12 methylthiotransferase RimO [Peptococcales bacterium]
MKNSVAMVSLGCPKNLVDSENMLALIKEANLQIINTYSEAEVIIINTCGFIESAQEESINTILEMAQYKKDGKCKVLIVVGCLVQKYQKELKREIPEIDAFLGTDSYHEIVETINRTLNREQIIKVKKDHAREYCELPRAIISPKPYAYLRIAEGCDNFCTYCAIPQIRGPFRSRPIENIIREANYLVSQGVKEIILVAQDISHYGKDIYGKIQLVPLLRELAGITELRWIRLLYCYPNNFSDELIEIIKTEPKICKYIDLPLQHADDSILRKMGRQITQADIRNLILKLRANIPEIVIRSTFIVGFPGETEDNFINLLNFLNEMKLERVGAFLYSKEQNTPAAKMNGQVHKNTKKRRLKQLMERQYQILLEQHQKYIGKIIVVQVDEFLEENNDLWVCRSMGEAPEIDPMILVYYPQDLYPGQLLEVRITHLKDYDLIGEIHRELT